MSSELEHLDVASGAVEPGTDESGPHPAAPARTIRGVGPAHGSWRGLVRSFTALASGEAAARLLGFVALVVMARQLGPRAFGVVVFGTTLVAWFGLIVDSGTEVLGTRDISHRPERLRSIAEPLLGLRLATSILAAGIFALAATFVAPHGQRDVLIPFALVLPMVALNLRWMVLGVKAAKAVAAGNVGSQLLIVVGVLLLVGGPGDAIAVPLLQAGGELVYGVIVMVAIARRYGLLRPRIDLDEWRATLRAGLPLMGTHLARAVLYSFDLLMIGLLLSSPNVGLYGAAYKPVLFVTGVVGLFSLSFLSSYSSAQECDRPALTSRTTRTAFAVTLPLAFALSLGAGTLVELVYGKSYTGATEALAILAWTLPLLALAATYSSVLTATHRQGLVMRHNCAGAGFAILATLIAVPLAGISGAAAVTVFGFGIVLVLNYRSAVRLGLGPPIGIVLGRRPPMPAPSALSSRIPPA